MSEYWHLSGDREGSRIKSFATSGKNGKTTLRIEIEITDPWEVGSLLRQAQEAHAPSPSPAPIPTPPPRREPSRLSRTLALPAPERKS